MDGTDCGVALDLLSSLDFGFPVLIHLPYYMYDLIVHSPKSIPIGIGNPSLIPNSGWNSNLNPDSNWNSKLNS